MSFLYTLDGIFWGYIAFILIIVMGVILSIRGRFFQIRAFPSIIRDFCLFAVRRNKGQGVHPLKTFFTSVGGMIGIGNIAGVITAVQIGGPGALFWVWIAGLVGGVIKYAEVYLGFKYRQKNAEGGYNGGPMYFLRAAFNSKLIPLAVAFLLCIYGVEIYQFTVVVDSVSANFEVSHYLVGGVLLTLVLYASLGGVSRVGKICALVMPLFTVMYVGMGLWVLIVEYASLPAIFQTIVTSAFTGHAAVGGFAGSGMLLAIQHGMSRAAYSGDIGIGYDSILQSESSTTVPEKQAGLSILGVCIDNIVCTMSILVALASGVWTVGTEVDGSALIQTALSQYFPAMHVFMPSFIFIVGYSTTIAYFCVGIKCAEFIHPRRGRMAYLVYGTAMFIFFSFSDQATALLIMSLTGAMLLIVNLLGMYKLRREVQFPRAFCIAENIEIEERCGVREQLATPHEST